MKPIIYSTPTAPNKFYKMYSEFANMPILGSIPSQPANDFVSGYVEKCRQKDIIEEIAGDEDAWYDTEQYFENTINEIADNMGLTTNGVLSIIFRVKDKFSRNLFIINNMGVLSDDEIVDVLNSGIANVNFINCNDFI